MNNTDLRALPSVERILQDVHLSALAGQYSRTAVTGLVRIEIERARLNIRNGMPPPPRDAIVAAVLERAREAWSPWPRRVINATGVVLHTNLGRAPLSTAAINAASAAAAGYSDLEFDMSSGKRGSRQSHISEQLAHVTGAEAGMAVNNNASAVMLALSTIASGREVIVSRGEAVEIGGGFRVPDVMRQSGAVLVEIGTTNRTYAADYASAITERTAAILKVHPSNFTVSGFTHSPDLAELGRVAREHNIPLLNDLGSGSLLDTARYGMAHEPTVQDSIRDGASLTMFSGDKLLGGPQAGLIAGAAELVKQLGSHPLARAVRIDKMTLAALSATLTAYLGESAETDIPIWRMISSPVSDLKSRAESWREAAKMGAVRESESAIGGGSLPGQTLPTFVLAIRPGIGPDEFCAHLRQAATPVIARIEDDEVLLDPRTVMDGEDNPVIEALKTAGGES
ncbi:MAG: L-seryl-tRNA(Sec) selenium transferase [Dehalococcoidia bacterium]